MWGVLARPTPQQADDGGEKWQLSFVDDKRANLRDLSVPAAFCTWTQMTHIAVPRVDSGSLHPAHPLMLSP